MNIFQILYTKIISEDYNMDISKIKEMGYTIVDEISENNWRMFLYTEGNFIYIVGLTTLERGFSTPSDQIKQKSGLSIKQVMNAYPQIVEKLKEWCGEYGKLYIGSYNTMRVMGYRRILKKEFNTSKISTINDGTGIAYYFTIESKE